MTAAAEVIESSEARMMVNCMFAVWVLWWWFGRWRGMLSMFEELGMDVLDAGLKVTSNALIIHLLDQALRLSGQLQHLLSARCTVPRLAMLAQHR